MPSGPITELDAHKSYFSNLQPEKNINNWLSLCKVFRFPKLTVFQNCVFKTIFKVVNPPKFALNLSFQCFDIRIRALFSRSFWKIQILVFSHNGLLCQHRTPLALAWVGWHMCVLPSLKFSNLLSCRTLFATIFFYMVSLVFRKITLR